MKYSLISLMVAINVLLLAVLTLVVVGVIDLPHWQAGAAAGIEGAGVVAIESDSVAIGATPINTQRPISSSEQENIAIYDSRNVGVVNITTEVISYNWFFEPVPQRGATGSGSIIDERGYVLTNNHVVENAAQVFVTLASGERYTGEVVGIDAENDIAVLKFNPRPGTRVTAIPFGVSADLRIGLKVLAIGNPFGLDRTLTTGIISGINRPVRVSQNLVVNNMIQTDASINPGNSGGPLLDASGNLIGINTAIFSPSGGSIGIGFAVPVDTARRVVPELIELGTVRRGWIEIVPRQLFPQLVQFADLPVERGILISELSAEGNAARAGLRGGARGRAVRFGRTLIYLGGDIIVGIDEEEVFDVASLYAALEETRPGQVVWVRYMRDGQERGVEVTLAERPQQYELE